MVALVGAPGAREYLSWFAGTSGSVAKLPKTSGLRISATRSGMAVTTGALLALTDTVTSPKLVAPRASGQRVSEGVVAAEVSGGE